MTKTLEELLVTNQSPFLVAEKKMPAAFRAGSVRKDGVLTAATGAKPSDFEATHDNLLRDRGYDPAEWRITSVTDSEWDVQTKAGTDTFQAFKFTAVPRGPEDVTYAVDIEGARKRLQKYKLPKRIPGSGLGPEVGAVLNLADIQGGKSEGGGVKATEQRLLDGLENFQAYVNKQRKIGVNLNKLMIVNNGDPYEGCAGNYDSQLFMVELNHRGQMNFVLDVWQTYARELFPQFDQGEFVSVLCNHTEMGRMGARKNQTSDSDSGGAFLAETLQRILAGRSEFDHVNFTIPHDEMNVFVDFAGIPMGFNHGHKIPGNDAAGFEKWLNGQVRGDSRAHAVKIWVTAHRHNFQCWDLGSATGFQCPSADGGSKWLKDMNGKYSRAGILSFLVGEHHHLGWSDVAFL